MLAITEKVLTEYLKANEEYKLDEVINIKKYTVASSPLSYRQTNSLDENKLLDTERENKLGWRKFSYKELLYFNVIFALREFGIKNEQLMPLWESFFKEPAKDKSIELNKKTDAEIAIGCSWIGVEMTLIVDSKGNVIYADPHNMTLTLISEPHIRIILNKTINKLNDQLGLERISVVHTLKKLSPRNQSKA